MLSSAFNSAAAMDSAHYKKFDPGDDFKNEMKLISKQTLKLLHERRGWTNLAEELFQEFTKRKVVQHKGALLSISVFFKVHEA